MIREYRDKLVTKVEALTLRERVMVFVALALLWVFLIEALFFTPLFERHRQLLTQVRQQQEKTKALQSRLESLMRAQKDGVASPLHERIKQLQQRIREGEAYLKSRSDKLVPPEKMGDLLGQVLNKNGRLQLVALDTLAATPLIAASAGKPDGDPLMVKSGGQTRQIYKHGVKITLRGSYADLLQYLEEIERLNAQMLWGAVQMEVLQYPGAELTLTLYTLNLDTIWLQV